MESPPGHVTEMETFLPQSGNNKETNNIGKYKVAVVPAKIRDEAVELNHLDNKDYWDPFKERKLAHPVTDGETLTHLLKASLGTGILSMPSAFMNAGLSGGIVLTVLVSIVCTHCAYILVECGHRLYRRTRVTAMSFPDIGEVAFAKGPQWGRKFSGTARLLIQLGLFLAYFGTCSVYSVIIAKNLQKVLEVYVDTGLSLRHYIAVLGVPLVLLSWVPNLKSLAPFSMVANLLMGVGLGITFYYVVTDSNVPTQDEPLPQVGDLSHYPQAFSIIIFALEAIGVVMPLENNMQTPNHFVGICGVLNQGMGGVTMIYILLGFLGYLKYGSNTQMNITNNLPDEIPPQIANIAIAIAVFFTFGLQFFVCLGIVWNGLKDNFEKSPKVYEYGLRTLVAIAAVGLAVAVPEIGPWLGLIGAFCFSLLGLIFPVLIEIVTVWETGFGPGNWRLWKNLLILIFGIMALIFGTQTSIQEIIDMGKPVLTSTVSPFLNGTSSIVNETMSTLSPTSDLSSTVAQ